MKKIILLCLISTILISCSKYGHVNLQFPTQPIKEFPTDIKRLAVVNRSSPLKSNGLAIAEALLSGEVAGSDKKAAVSSLQGVYNKLNGWRNVEVVVLDKRKLNGTGTRELPALLDWGLVKHLCDSTKTDALLVLENFDSNTDVVANVVNNTVNTAATGVPPVSPAASASRIRMNVTCNWRLYNPKTQQVIDQYQSHTYLLFTPGPLGIAIPPPEALPQTATKAGEEYAQRFLPVYNNVQRLLYKKGKGSQKQAIKAAFRKSEVADWNGAIENWNELLKGASPKNAGRLCLNIAVGYEVLGNTGSAQDWAKKAYELYGNKLARNYLKDLNYRAKWQY